MSNRLPSNTDELLIGACLSSEVPESVSATPAVQQFLTSAQPFSVPPDQTKHKRPRVIIPTNERDPTLLQTAVTKLNKSPSPISQYRIERPARQDEIMPSWLRESIENLNKIQDEPSARTKTEVSKECIGDVSWLEDAHKSLKRQVKHTGLSPARIELDKNMAELHLSEMENGLPNIGDRLNSERDRLENSFTYFYEEEVRLDIGDATTRLAYVEEKLPREANASGEGYAEMVKTKEQRQRELVEKFKEKKTSVKCDIFARPKIAMVHDKDKGMADVKLVKEVTIGDLNGMPHEPVSEQYTSHEKDLMENGPKQAWGSDNLSEKEISLDVNAHIGEVKPGVAELQAKMDKITVLDKQGLAKEIEAISKIAKEKKKKVDVGEACGSNGQKVKEVVCAHTPKLNVSPKTDIAGSGKDFKTNQHKEGLLVDEEDKRIYDNDSGSGYVVGERNAETERKKKKRKQHRPKESNEAASNDERNANRSDRKKKKRENTQDMDYAVAGANRNVKGHAKRSERCEVVQRDEPARQKKKRMRHRPIISWSTKPGSVTHQEDLPMEEQHVDAKRESQASDGISAKEGKINQRKHKGDCDAEVESSVEVQVTEMTEKDGDDDGIIERSLDKKKQTIEKQKRRECNENVRTHHAEPRCHTDADTEAAGAASGDRSTELLQETKNDRNMFQRAWNRIRKLFIPKVKEDCGAGKSRKKKIRGSLFSCLNKQKD